MARPASMSKRDNEKKRENKRLEKLKRKEERKQTNNKGAALEDMFMYVDENGQLTSTPPELRKKEEIDLESIVISTPKKSEEEENPVHKGRIDYFNESKGFGFVKELGSINKYFFHISNTQVDVKEGNIVFFEVERGPKDLNAVNLRFEEQPKQKPSEEQEPTVTNEEKED